MPKKWVTKKNKASPLEKTCLGGLHVLPTRQEEEEEEEGVGVRRGMWPHPFKFMQCSLMMLCCVRALRNAKCWVATLLIALHKLQHRTGAALPFFSLAVPCERLEIN